MSGEKAKRRESIESDGEYENPSESGSGDIATGGRDRRDSIDSDYEDPTAAGEIYEKTWSEVDSGDITTGGRDRRRESIESEGIYESSVPIGTKKDIKKEREATKKFNKKIKEEKKKQEKLAKKIAKQEAKLIRERAREQEILDRTNPRWATETEYEIIEKKGNIYSQLEPVLPKKTEPKENLTPSDGTYINKPSDGTYENQKPKKDSENKEEEGKNKKRDSYDSDETTKL